MLDESVTKPIGINIQSWSKCNKVACNNHLRPALMIFFACGNIILNGNIHYHLNVWGQYNFFHLILTKAAFI